MHIINPSQLTLIITNIKYMIFLTKHNSTCRTILIENKSLYNNY